MTLSPTTPAMPPLSTHREMQLQLESPQPTLQMQKVAFARACAETLATALAQASQAAKAEAATAAVSSARYWAEAEAEAKTRVEEKLQTWTQLQAETHAELQAEAEARAVALVRAERQVRARAFEQVTTGEIMADLALIDIIYSIQPEYRHNLTWDLWRHPEHWWLIQIFVPITRLPQELLQEILFMIIDNAINSPVVLMRVSRLWYMIVTGLWGSIKLGTKTPKGVVTRKLERNQWLLDVVIDTEFDRDYLYVGARAEGAHQAILTAIQAAPRWRSLVVEAFPAQTDLPEHIVDSGLQQCSMSRLRSFKIKCPCDTSSLLQCLLSLLGTATSGELTTVEINSANVISFLAPTYPSIFHSVKVLCLDTPRLPDPVDLLPHLHQLESLTASHLSLPIYRHDVNIPFVHTLRHLSLRAVSIQWMSGRTFLALESCTLLYPLHSNVLHTFSTTLPNCNDLTFQGYPLDALNGISAHNLTHLTVKCSCFERLPGGRQLVRFSNHAIGENRLAPRILHLSIEATNQAWIKAFALMSNLEELVISSADPASLGAKALQALVVHPVHANNLDTTSTHGVRYAPQCPSLKRFGLRYHRWLRPSEQFDLIPELATTILSRQQTRFSLQSFHIWKESGQEEPLELIEGSWVSLKAFERLTNNGAFRADGLLRLVASRLSEMRSLFPACPQM